MAEGHAIVWAGRILFISASIPGHMGYSHPSSLVNNAVMELPVNVQPLLSILAGIYPQEALLGHVAIPCVIF